MKMYAKGMKVEFVDSPIFLKAFYCATKYSCYAFLWVLASSCEEISVRKINRKSIEWRHLTLEFTLNEFSEDNRRNGKTFSRSLRAFGELKSSLRNFRKFLFLVFIQSSLCCDWPTKRDLISRPPVNIYKNLTFRYLTCLQLDRNLRLRLKLNPLLV